MFYVRILPSLYGFPCGSNFCLNRLLLTFKFTTYFTPRCVGSLLCVDLTKRIPGIIPSISNMSISHKTKCHTSTVTCFKSKFKILPVKNDHSRQMEITKLKILFRMTYWSMICISYQVWSLHYISNVGSTPSLQPAIYSHHSFYCSRTTIANRSGHVVVDEGIIYIRTSEGGERFRLFILYRHEDSDSNFL